MTLCSSIGEFGASRVKWVLVVLLLGVMLIGGCASGPRHDILGTTWGWNEELKIIRDLKISGLQIRQVRSVDSNCSKGFSDHIELFGEIGPDSTEVISRLLSSLDKCINEKGAHVVPKVYLNSYGGLLNDGIKLGELFRAYPVSTRIPGGAICASACAIAFLGGEWRNMDSSSTILFHAPYIIDFMGTPKCSGSGSAKLIKYTNKMLGSENSQFVYDRMMDYCSTKDGWTVNKDAAVMFNIIKN